MSERLYPDLDKNAFSADDSQSDKSAPFDGSGDHGDGGGDDSDLQHQSMPGSLKGSPVITRSKSSKSNTSHLDNSVNCPKMGGSADKPEESIIMRRREIHANNKGRVSDQTEKIEGARSDDKKTHDGNEGRVSDQNEKIEGARSDDKKTQSTKKSRFDYRIIIIIIIAIICIFVPIYLYVQFWYSHETTNKIDKVDLISAYKTELGNVKEKFPSQTDVFWRKVKAATMTLLDTDKALKPAVILIVSTEHSHTTGHCIAKQLAAIFTRVIGVISPVLSIPTTSGSMKTDFYYHIHRSLNTSRMAVVLDLHRLPADAAELLQGVCDDQNAPCKDALVLLTITVPSNIKDELRVHEYMMQLWAEQLTEENVAAICSRITGSVVFVVNEKLKSASQC